MLHSAHLDTLRGHMDNPAMSHLRGFLTDLVSTLENHDNGVTSLVGATVEGYRDDIVNQVKSLLDKFHESIIERVSSMSQIVEQLKAVVDGLVAKIAEHDVVVQNSAAALKEAAANNDTTAIQAQIDVLTGASSKLAGETQALKDATAQVVVPAATDTGTPA